MSFRKCLLVVATVVNLIAVSSASATITRFVDQADAGSRFDVLDSAGFGFSIGATDVTINKLGFVDLANDGLDVAHDVGIYHYTGTTHELIAKATIPPGTSTTWQDGYRWVSISPVLLNDHTGIGNNYKLMASQGSDAWYNNGITVVTASFGSLTGLGFTGPSMGVVGSTAAIVLNANPYGGPNMGFAEVPEPSSLALLVSAAVIVGLRRNRRVNS